MWASTIYAKKKDKDSEIVPEKPRRVQMDLNGDDFERLNSLKQANDGSYSDVMKEALRLYEFMLKEELEGSKFYTKEPSGDLVRIRIFK